MRDTKDIALLNTYEDQVRDRLVHVWNEVRGRLVLDEE